MKASISQSFAGNVSLNNGSGIAGRDLIIYAPTYVSGTSEELQRAKEAGESFLARLPPSLGLATTDSVERVIQKMKACCGKSVEFVKLAWAGSNDAALAALWSNGFACVGIEGDAGAGKTTFLQKLAHDWAIGDFMWKDKFDIVVVARLRLVSGESQTMEEIMLRCVFRGDRSWTHDVRSFLAWCKAGGRSRVLWLLDGWDEIDLSDELEAIKDGLESDHVQYALVSGRPGSLKGKGFQHKLKLHGFDEAGIDRFIEQHCRGDALAASSAKRAVASARWLKDACRLPLLLKFVCMVGGESRNHTELYSHVVDLFLDNEALKNAEKSRRREVTTKLRADLRRLAFLSFQMRTTIVPATMLCHDTCGLLIPVEWKFGKVSSYEWMHLSVQEFLAAEFVCLEQYDEANVKIVLSCLWQEAEHVFFTFLCGFGLKAALRFSIWFPENITDQQLLEFFEVADVTLFAVLCVSRRDLVSEETCFPLICNRAKTGDTSVLACSLEKLKFPVDLTWHERTPLFLACAYGQLDTVKWLLAYGADPGFVSKRTNRNLLHSLSCHWDWHPGEELSQVIELVFPLVIAKCPSSVHACMGRHRLTPLHTACDSGYVHLAKLLLQHGANINAKQRDGRTPLHRACKMARLNVVALLLEQDDIEVDATDSKGQTPLHFVCCWENYIATMGFRYTCGKRDTSIEIAKLLLKYGASLSARDVHGRTPLHLACKYSKGLAEFLIPLANVNVRDSLGRTPLHWACISAQFESRKCLQLLLDKDTMLLDAVDVFGATALVMAIHHGFSHGLIEFLWRAGLSGSVNETYFPRAAFYCVQKKRRESIEQLPGAQEAFGAMASLSQDAKDSLEQWLKSKPVTNTQEEKIFHV